MQTAALQALGSAMKRLEIRYVGGSLPTVNPQLAIQTGTVFLDLPEKNRWRMELALEVRGGEGQTPFPYEIAITLMGDFVVVAEIEPETARRLAFVNGMSILYGSARETLLLLTGRFPAGAFILPTLSFVGEYERLAPLTVAETPTPYGGQK